MDSEIKAFRVNPTDTVRHIKELVREEKNVPCEQQRLVFAGQPLTEDYLTLNDYCVKEDCALYLMFRLPVGI